MAEDYLRSDERLTRGPETREPRGAEHDPARAPYSDPSRQVRLKSTFTVRGNKVACAAAMQSMQQTHGNRAVQRFLQRTQSPTRAQTLPVQREVCAASGHSDPRVAAWYGGECTDELNTTRYTSAPVGNYAVVPGAPGHRRALAPRSRNEVTESEHQRVSNAWDRLDTRIYINGRGSNAEENQRLQQSFRNMLREDMSDSPTLRNVVSNIGLGDQTPFAVNVGEHQRDVFGDSFETRDVDLADLAEFGTGREANRHREQVSRGEVITHFLAERYHDVTHPAQQQAIPADVNPAQAQAITERNYRARFNPSHNEAVEEQNRYRAERGQSRILSSDITGPDRLTEQSTARFRMQGGTTQEMTIDPNSDIIESHMLGAPTAHSRRGSRNALAHPVGPQVDYATAAELARRDLMDLEQNY